MVDEGASSGANRDAASNEECDEYDRHDFEVLSSLHEVDLRDFSQKFWNACDLNFGTLLSKSKHFLPLLMSMGTCALLKELYRECNVKKLNNDGILRVQLQTHYLDRQKLIEKSVERRTKVIMEGWAKIIRGERGKVG